MNRLMLLFSVVLGAICRSSCVAIVNISLSIRNVAELNEFFKNFPNYHDGGIRFEIVFEEYTIVDEPIDFTLLQDKIYIRLAQFFILKIKGFCVVGDLWPLIKMPEVPISESYPTLSFLMSSFDLQSKRSAS